MSKKKSADNIGKELDLLIQEIENQEGAGSHAPDLLRKFRSKLGDKKAKRPEKGIETWFRLASRNLYTRRQIVDTKSNILITTNAIIISVVLGTLYVRLGEDPHLIYPIVALVLTNVFSIAFAIFATRPTIADGQAAGNEDRSSDLMTFDDFYRLPEEAYKAKVHQVMEDGPLLYASITKDIYKLGVDLSRRYRYIRHSYDIFLYGIILSIIGFGLCHALF